MGSVLDRFDVALEVIAACRGRRDAWGFLRRFTELWATRLDESSGCDDQELTAAEHRLGLTLPVAVREGYALLGRRDDLTSNQDSLLRPDQLHFDEAGQALVFRVENQAAAYWGIAVEDLRLDDPPVIFQLDAPRGAPQPWRRFLDRFSLACVEMVLAEYMLGGSSYYDNRESGQTALGLLERHYARPAMPDYPMWASPEEPPVRWFAGRDVLIRDDSRDWMWVGARTPEALQTVRQTIPGDWLIEPSSQRSPAPARPTGVGRGHRSLRPCRSGGQDSDVPPALA
jgi:hypothetical protein